MTQVIAICCYLTALAGLGTLAVLVLLLGQGCLPEWAVLPNPWPWLVNGAWLAGFALQHSGMARTRFKRWCLKFVPAPLERSVYAALSGLILLGLSLTWQPLPGPALWQLPDWVMGISLAAGSGLGLICLRFDHAGLFGLRQARGQGPHPADEQLLVVGPYRYVRHPLMAATLVFLWAQPVMSPTLATLAGGLTLYIVIGLCFEERDLLKRFGPAYADYRRRVPALVPWRSPAAPATYPAVTPCRLLCRDPAEERG